MAVAYQNLIVTDGNFRTDTLIGTITVPVGGLKAGALLGKVTATGKYVLSLLAAVDGSQNAVAVLETDIANATAAAIDVKEVVYIAGTFNSTGVTFGTGQTIANTYNSLHSNSINIIQGIM